MTMIALTMTQDEKNRIAQEASQKLNRLYASAIIAGGYPRDIILGAKPKDIDIFIDSSYFPTQDARDRAADNIFAAYGQTWTRVAEEAGLEPNQYGEIGPGPVTEGFQVYYSVTNDGDWENLNLIFSRHNERVTQFDWSICRAFSYTDGIEFGRNDRQLNNIVLMNTDNMPLVVKHAKRLKDKYPEAVFKIPTRYLSDLQIYRQLLDGGIIDGPREVLQAQGQDFAGNEVRQQAGTDDRRDAFTTNPAGGFTPEMLARWAQDQQERQAAFAQMARINRGPAAAQRYTGATQDFIAVFEDAAQPAPQADITIDDLVANQRPTTPARGRTATARQRAQDALNALRGIPRQ